MITTQKMVRKEISFEYSLGVPSFTPEGELTFEHRDQYVELNILVPEAYAVKGKEFELQTWLKLKWEEEQSDCAYIHSVYIHEGDS